MNPNHRTVNVANEQADPQSVLSFYKRLIALRLSDPILLTGKYHLIDTHDHQLYVYVRESGHQGYLIITNLSDTPASYQITSDYRNLELILTNSSAEQNPATMKLQPWSAYLYKYERK